MTFADVLCGGSCLAAALLVLAASVAYWYLSMPRDVPPGPRGLPLVGYLPFLGSNPPIALSKLSKTYGGIISLYLGNRFVVVINDARLIREALVKQGETFAGRPRDLNFSAAINEEDSKYSLIMQDGAFFKDHRRFALQVLRDCGFGKSSLEPLVSDEIQHFVTELKSYQGRAKDLRSVLTLSVANNITLMVLGRRFDYNDPWIIQFTHDVEVAVKHASSAGAITFFPWLASIPGFAWFMGQKELLEGEERTVQALVSLLSEYEGRHLDEKRGNYFNAFKSEQDARQAKDLNDDSFSDTVLRTNLRLFLSAGSETTATTLSWFIKYMMAHPDVQKKVQREIDVAIGIDRLPSCQDQPNTPYTLATIAEVQRVSTLVPLSVPHRTKQECRVNGYRIPKDTFVMPNLWHAHNDPQDFPDPSTFRPERHLDEQGQFVKPENMVAFSLGKRQCLGEPLARMELYLYATILLRTFDFRCPEGEFPSLEGHMGITYAPKSFVTRALPRQRD